MVDDETYFELSDEQMNWFVALVEGMVSKPEKVICLRVMDGHSLEIALIVASEDEHVFDPMICEMLKESISEQTGVLSPVVYLSSKPHPEAEASILAAEPDT